MLRTVVGLVWFCLLHFVPNIFLMADFLLGNDKIESQLQRGRLTVKQDIRILLLEAGESGKVSSSILLDVLLFWPFFKSTLLKCIKLIHNGGYNDFVRKLYKQLIFSNTIQSMRSVSRRSYYDLKAMSYLILALTPQFSKWHILRRYSLLPRPNWS